MDSRLEGLIVFAGCLIGVVLLLTGLWANHTWTERRARRRAGDATTPAAPAPTPLDAPAPTTLRHATTASGRGIAPAPDAARGVVAPPAPLPLAQWWPQLVGALHVRIIGPTNSGKSTLAQALAAELPGQLYVIDPVWRPGSWGGLPAVTVDEAGEYDPIGDAITRLIGELRRRGAALQRSESPGQRLTVLWDEVPDTIAELPDAGRLVRRLGQRGRHVNMHLIALGQSDRVAAWGLEGHGDSRANFATVYLGRAAVELAPHLAGAERPAVLETGGVCRPISLEGVADLAQRPIDAARVWLPAQPQPQQRPPAIPAAPVAPSAPVVGQSSSQISTEQRDAMVVRMAAAGWSQDRIRRKLADLGCAIAQARLVELHRAGRTGRNTDRTRLAGATV